MYKPVYIYTAKPCNFNGMNGYMLRQYVNGEPRIEQFVHSLVLWCKAAGIPLDSIIIID